MKEKYKGMAITAVLIISVFFSGCGPGQFLGPTVTPSPTPTSTPTITPSPTATSTSTPTFTPSPTPIPGIEEPITVNGIDIQIQYAKLGVALPAGYRFTTKDVIALEIDIAFSDTDAGEKLRDEIVVVDENAHESQVSISIVTFGTGRELDPPQQFLYAVSKDAKVFSLRFPDGQVIDLMPLLKFL